MLRRIGVAISIAVTSAIQVPFALAGSGEDFFIKSAGPSNEQYQKDVDEVAKASQERAINKLQALLKKYKGTRQEATLLFKMAELQQQNASILFRIAHADANKKRGKAVDNRAYNKTMESSIDTLNVLIAKYPSFEDTARAYFLRAKALEELGKKEAAGKDYLHLVKNHPELPEVPNAYMALAEFAIEKGDHPRAITFLNQVEKLPNDPHFPFALYKLAWAHYNLRDIPKALSFAERQIAYYNERFPSQKNVPADLSPNSDLALRDNTLLDVTTFYLEGFEQKLAQYRTTEALSYFKKLESGPMLGKMISKYAKLLRSHEHEKDLNSWKDLVLLSESDRPESLDVLMIAYEHQRNKRLYTAMIDSAKDMVKLYALHKTFEAFPKAQKLLLESAEALQNAIVKNKEAEESFAMSKTLATLYDSFTKVVEESDPRIPRVHHNLAETLFTIKDYSGATDHYRWVVDHGNWNKKHVNYKTTLEASLKAIGSRYEVLRQRNLIPKELTAVSLQKNSDKALDPLLSRWIEWIDFHAKEAEDKKPLENFVFEGNRAIYASNQILTAVTRFKSFSKKFPKSNYAIPSASIVIDTAIATGDWAQTVELAEDFLEIEDWKKAEFSKRLYVASADASYKILEKQYRDKDFKGVLKLADKFLKKYDKSQRIDDCLSLAGNSANEVKDPKKAAYYFTRLITDTPKSDNLGPALLARGAISEDTYKFLAAAGDYKTYLSLPAKHLKLDEKQGEGLRKKIVVLTWLGGNSTDLRSTLESKLICTENLSNFCERYSILATLSDPSQSRDESTTETAFERTRKESGESRTLWAALALEGAKNLAFRDRLVAIRAVSSGWEELDPLIKFAVLPYLSVSITKALQLNRLGMREVAPLRADAKYITRRVEVIREMENAATKIMKLPWARIRAESLNEMAGLYIDLAKGLTNLNPPKNLNEEELNAYNDTIKKLILPFEEKGQEMRGKAFEIASRFMIEDESFSLIADPFFAENPSQAKKIRPDKDVPKPMDLGVKFVAKVDSFGRWDPKRDDDTDDRSNRVRSLWSSAIEKKRWPQIAFFIQEAHEKKLLDEAALGVMKAVSFTSAGARGEGIQQVAEVRKSVAPEVKNLVAATLVGYAMRACAKSQAETYVKDLRDLPPDQLGRDHTRTVSAALSYLKK